MAWPHSQDYNEVIQDLGMSFSDAELKQGEVVTNELGLPQPCSGCQVLHARDRRLQGALSRDQPLPQANAIALHGRFHLPRARDLLTFSP